MISVVPHRSPCSTAPTVLISVKSAILEFQYRQTIRQTYAIFASQLNMRVIFFLGSHEDQFFNNVILLESQLYDDIVQVDFMDSYRNVTLKSYSMLRWQVMMCSNAKYYFNTDSDVIVFPKHLLEFVSKMETQTNSIIGHCKLDGAVVVRDVESKWYVPKEAYPDEWYVPHCLGCGYISTGDVPIKLINALEDSPDNWKRWKDMPIDDVVFSGVLVKAANVTLHNSDIVSWLEVDFDLCLQRVVSVHRFDPPTYMKEAWLFYHDVMQNCTSVENVTEDSWQSF